MDILLGVVLPILVITAIITAYAWFLVYNKNRSRTAHSEFEERNLISVQTGQIVPFMDADAMKFFNALKAALPPNYIAVPNVSIEMLFDYKQRFDLHIGGQYGDFVIFTEKYVPALVIDVYDTSLMTLESAKIIKKQTKELLRKSGVPLLEYSKRDTYSIDDLRRAMGKAMNPMLDTTNKPR